MFSDRALADLYREHKGAIVGLVKLGDRLKERFYGMDEAVHCLLLAALTGEAMVMIGPPGTAKSRLIRSFCNLLGLLRDEALHATAAGGEERRDSDAYFEYLLTQFTEPSELFGFYDLGRLFHNDPTKKAFVRDTEGMMQKAQVVFLDEVFNASSAILNALLTFMNERKFHDRGKIERTQLKLLFSATNHPPREEGLGAVYDRFLLRCRMDNARGTPQELSALIGRAWAETHATPASRKDEFRGLLGQLETFRGAVDNMTASGALRVQQEHPIFVRLADMVTDIRRRELSLMSNRRLVKFTGVILAEALLRAAQEGAEPRIQLRDLTTILRFGLDADDPGAVRKMAEHLEA